MVAVGAGGNFERRPAQLDELLTWLGADERRWSIVDGVALVSVAGRPPVTVTAPEPQQQARRPMRPP